MISDAYRQANEHLHATTEYGVTAPHFIQAIRQIAAQYKAITILDYGSGPREHVKRALGSEYTVRSYDPCVPALAHEPTESANLLVSCDVLEHVEPEYLGSVLDHMARLTNRVAFLTISTVPAGKTLPDGRNAHLIQEGAEFWLPRLMQRWRLRGFQEIGPELVCVVEAR